MPSRLFPTIKLDKPASFVLVLVAAIGLSFATRAGAHAIVVTSTPAANAVVPSGPLVITIGFNTRLDRARSRLAVEAPDGTKTDIVIAKDTAPTTIGGRAEVSAEGRWKVRWQVLAADGHITRGEIPFRVRHAEHR